MASLSLNVTSPLHGAVVNLRCGFRLKPITCFNKSSQVARALTSFSGDHLVATDDDD